MSFQDVMREALARLDVDVLRRLWVQLSPHLPQPKTDAEALQAAHMARTQTKALTAKQRAYSHAWLREHDLPSMLPDHEKQAAERLYPRVVAGVGLSVNARDPELQPIANEIRQSMEDAVLDAESHGRLLDTPFVRARMSEARAKRKREIFGLTGLYAMGRRHAADRL